MRNQLSVFVAPVTGVAFIMLSQPAMLAQAAYGGPGPGPGPGAGGNYNSTPYVPPSQPYQLPPIYVPAGQTLSASLQTSISTDAARPGDQVEAQLTQAVTTGNGQVPAGSVLEGHVTSARSGGFLTRAGMLTVQFDHLRLPNGMSVPMSAHIVGDLGKYKQIGNGSDTYAGEGAGTKVGQAVLRSAIGAGAGAALGTAVGAIAGHGMNSVSYRPIYGPFGHQFMPVGYQPQFHNGAALGAGRGAWSGAAIGGGVGLADSLLLRKGKNVVVSSGTSVQLQLDTPIQIGGPGQYGNI